MDLIRKSFLPWTAERSFASREDYLRRLTTLHRLWNNLRAICLLLAALTLIVGYVLDQYSIMVLTALPLVLVLLLSLIITKIEEALGGQNKSETATKE